MALTIQLNKSGYRLSEMRCIEIIFLQNINKSDKYLKNFWMRKKTTISENSENL